MNEPFVSYAQNGEDVVLWRALGHVENGRYVDVGAGDPVELSVTKVLYDRGWRGVDIDPAYVHFEHLAKARPDNEVVHADLGSEHASAGFDASGAAPTRSLDDVLSSSALLAGEAIHLLKIAAGQAEAAVLDAVAIEKWRPWVVVVAAIEPVLTQPTHERWEPALLAAGYVPCLFNGLSRFYVSTEHLELASHMSYPACALDHFITAREQEDRERSVWLEHHSAQMEHEMVHWRNRAIAAWADSAERVRLADQRTAKAIREAIKRKAQVRRMTAQVAGLRKRVATYDRRFESRVRRKIGQALRRLGLR